MRKDAQRNRQRLILAAADIMRNEGSDVPMELIAERAGLTRGTLYRNFPHRQAIYEAVLEHDLEAMSVSLVQEGDANPLAFVHRLTELMMVYDKFLIALSAMDDYDVEKNQARMVAAIAAPLAKAQSLGVLRTDLDGPGILMACRMLASHWKLDGQPDSNQTILRRLDLLIRGLGAACQIDQPDRRDP